MTDATAILELRHVRTSDHATLSAAELTDGEPGVFVAIEHAPPVRSVVNVIQGGGQRSLEVAWVVEVADQDERGARGFYGRWVDAEALERANQVGTEHWEDGTPVVQPVVSEFSVPINISDAPAMAMPAPVLLTDESVDEYSEESYGHRSEPNDSDASSMRSNTDEPTAVDADSYPAPEADAHPAEADASLASDGPSASNPGGGRKKRGRRRR